MQMTFNDPFPGSARIQVEIFPSKCDHESNYLEPETEANSVQTAERQKEPSPDDAASTLSPAAPEDDLPCFGFSISFFFFFSNTLGSCHLLLATLEGLTLSVPSGRWPGDRSRRGRAAALLEIAGRCVTIPYKEGLSAEPSEEGTSSLKRDFLISGRISKKHRRTPWRG